MATKYLEATYGGEIYEYSKNPKEGFEQHVSQKNNISYRKYYKKGVFGIYRGVELRNGNLGRRLSIQLLDQNNDTVYLQMPFNDQRNNIGDLSASFLSHLPYLEKDTFIYRFFAYSMDVPNSTYKNIGISIKFSNDWETVLDEPKVSRLTNSYYKKEDGGFVQGHIPAVTWVQNMGTKVPNKTDRDNYLYDLIVQYGSIQEAQGNTQTRQPQIQQPQVQQPQVPAQQPQIQQPQVQQPQVQQPQVPAQQPQVQQPQVPAQQPQIQQPQVPAQQPQVQVEQPQTNPPQVQYVPPPPPESADDDLPF